MAADDQREHIMFYGIYEDDWYTDFGGFSNHHYSLNRDYISEGCSTTESSLASTTHKFVYPHHIKKTYFIEGVIEGEICLAANGDDAIISSYRITICKMNINMLDNELKTTGWVTVNDTLIWDAIHSIGEEMVYHFRIDVFDKQKLSDEECLYLKIEVDCNEYAYLMHSNDKSWTDLWVDIPFML